MDLEHEILDALSFVHVILKDFMKSELRFIRQKSKFVTLPKSQELK